MTRRPRRAVAHLPVHAEALGDGREAGLQRSKIDREIGRGEYDAHKKVGQFRCRAKASQAGNCIAN